MLQIKRFAITSTQLEGLKNRQLLSNN